MPDTYTPVLALTKPEIGASRDSWGSKTNTNWDTLDQFVSMAMPVGAILDYAGTAAPPGWLICDGRLISRTTYARLFAAIGVVWGAGDGSTTFALPNTTGRSGIGPGSLTDANSTVTTFTLAQSGGAVSRQITQANLPNYTLTTAMSGLHAHTVTGGNHAHTTDAQGSHTHGASVAAVGDHQHAYQTNALGPVVYGGPSNVYFNNFENAGWNTSPAGAHTHGITINADGLHAHSTTASGVLTLTSDSVGNHNHTVTLGGGGVLLVTMQPYIVCTKIIYAGLEAATQLAAQAAVVTIEHEPLTELDELREEIAQLRALLMPPASRRLLSSPMRGTH